ncbi:MAG: hypothetical protein Mars2KO_28290 [Maribacter sp.]
MKVTDHTITFKGTRPTIDLSDIKITTVPKCSFSGIKADYYIGLSSKSSDNSVRIMGAVSTEMVETGINKLLGQGWDDIKWPVVLDMQKKVLYHSYEAHKNGASAILGWQEYFSKL